MTSLSEEEMKKRRTPDSPPDYQNSPSGLHAIPGITSLKSTKYLPPESNHGTCFAMVPESPEMKRFCLRSKTRSRKEPQRAAEKTHAQNKTLHVTNLPPLPGLCEHICSPFVFGNGHHQKNYNSRGCCQVPPAS
jgi:hypothetical protein